MANITTKKGTAASWTVSNPVLLEAQQGYETDTGRSKYGDGSTVWVSLPYADEISPRFLNKSNIAGLPDPTVIQPAVLFVSDSGKPAYSDGVNWRYFDDNSIIV